MRHLGSDWKTERDRQLTYWRASLDYWLNRPTDATEVGWSYSERTCVFAIQWCLKWAGKCDDQDRA